MSRAMMSGAVALLGCLASACSSRAADLDQPATRRIPFEALVAQLSVTPLAADDSSRLAAPVATLATRSRIVVLDRKRAELRMFTRSGALAAVAGNPGDRPGELRKPAAVAALDSGRFVVLDEGRRLLSFRDSLGDVLHEVALPEGAFTSIVPLVAEHRVVVAGRIFYGPDSIRRYDLHEFDYQGHHLASYGTTADTPTLWARAFATVLVAGNARELVTGTLASNRVRFIDRHTRTERWTSIAPTWYSAVEFPSDRLLQHGTTKKAASARVTDWTHQHRLLNAVFPLDGGRLLTRFQAFDPSGRRFYYYAISDGDGTQVVSTPTRVEVLDARGDTLSWIVKDAAKNASFVNAVVRSTLYPAAQLASSRR